MNLPPGCFRFFGSADEGFFGHLHDTADKQLCRKENTIIDYIRAARPDLFKKLRGLPVKTYHVPTNRKQPSRKSASDCFSSPLAQHYNAKQTNTESDTLLYRPKIFSLSRPHHTEQIIRDDMRSILARLFNGYRFVLRRVRDYSSTIPCVCSACSDCTSSLNFGDFFLTLMPDLNATFLHNTGNDLSFSLSCIESLFENSSTLSVHLSADVYSDLRCDGTIEMPRRKRDQQDNDTSTSNPTPVQDFPFHRPSNSTTNKLLRQQRDDEIEEFLRLDEKLEYKRNDWSTLSDEELPNLTLHRPLNHANIEARYRKQGLTKTGGAKSNKRQKVEDEVKVPQLDGSSFTRPTMIHPPPIEISSEQHLFCSCREPDSGDGFDVIKCAGDFCQTGYFHLRCLSIEQLPPDTDDFYCDNCAPCADQQQLHTDEGNTVEDSSSVSAAGTTFSNEKNGSYQQTLSKESSPVTGETVTRLCRPPLSPDSKARLVRLLQSSPDFIPVNRPSKAQPHAITPPSTLPSTHPPPQMDGHYDGELHLTANHTLASFPSTSNSTKVAFPSLAPFITPSLTDADPHTLTSDEARLFWCWRASQPESMIAKLLPGEERKALETEKWDKVEGLAAWCSKVGNDLKEREREDGKGKRLLSEVLEHCEV